MLPVVLIIMRLVKDDGEAIDHHKKGTRATGTFWSRAPSSPAGLAVACAVQWSMVDDRPQTPPKRIHASYVARPEHS